MAQRFGGTKFGLFDGCLDTRPSQTEASHEKTRGSEREQCMFDDELELASSSGLGTFSTINMH